jgi:hypothetical protein
LYSYLDNRHPCVWWGETFWRKSCCMYCTSTSWCRSASAGALSNLSGRRKHDCSAGKRRASPPCGYECVPGAARAARTPCHTVCTYRAMCVYGCASWAPPVRRIPSHNTCNWTTSWFPSRQLLHNGTAGVWTALSM